MTLVARELLASGNCLEPSHSGPASRVYAASGLARGDVSRDSSVGTGAGSFPSVAKESQWSM